MTVLAAGRYAAGLSGLLAIAAMVIYPGGSPYHREAGRYSFFQNFLSDLGGRVAYGGGSNLTGAKLFAACLVVAGFSLCACLVGILRVHARAPASRGWAIAAAATGALSCISLVGVALAPMDRYLRIHESLSNWAVCPLPAVAILLAVAAVRDHRFPPRSVVAWAILLVVLGNYLAVLLWGPALGTEGGHNIQVTGQKVAVLAAVIVLSYQSWEAERVESSEE